MEINRQLGSGHDWGTRKGGRRRRGGPVPVPWGGARYLGVLRGVRCGLVCRFPSELRGRDPAG